MGLSLARQFLLAGGAASLAAMILAGFIVTRLIEAAVTYNAGATTALYVDSVIAPLLPNMQEKGQFGDTDIRALDETLGQGALGERLMSFRLWDRDGRIIYSNDKELTGRRFPVNSKLREAFDGTVVAQFERAEDPESQKEKSSGRPLLEIYNPIRQPWSGEVVAVSEFYEIAEGLERTLLRAQLWSLFAVTGLTLVFFVVLSAIVLRGSRMIDTQRLSLSARVAELSRLLSQNEALRLKARQASERVSALNESHLRRVGADLHDGPAQLIAFASLRLESPLLTEPTVEDERREKEIQAIKTSLDDAMAEIRTISHGLVLPQVEAASLSDILKTAARAHQQRTNVPVALSLPAEDFELSSSEKTCIYRFAQETLNNGFRHGGGIDQRVAASIHNSELVIEVSDAGPGFATPPEPSHGLGLAGLRDRVESLGGQFSVDSSANGTVVRMSLSKKNSGLG